VLVADGTITGNVVTAASGAVTNGVTAETDLTITTNAGTTSAISYAANAGADAVATAINSAAGTLGVTATATNSAVIASLSHAGTVTFSLNNQAISVVVADQNDLSNVISAINGVQGTTGVTAAFTSTSSKASITLTTTDGRNIEFEDYTNSGNATASVSFGGTTLTEGTAVSAVKTGTISLSSTQGPIATANASAEVFAGAGVNNSSFLSVAALDISTASGAQSAIGALDSALTQINSSRGALGAYQNRFTSAIANLSDHGRKHLGRPQPHPGRRLRGGNRQSLTRNQILQQAGTAMLAQANALPQNVLTLIRG
jgi:flagellin